MFHSRLFLFTLAFSSIPFCISATAADWPQFRGPGGDGISPESDVPTTWSSDEHIKWKVDLPQPGNGSPIVSQGKVFVACAEDGAGLKRSLYCFDRTDGNQLWVKTVEFDKKMPTHKTNPYCGSTPAADGKHVVVWHGSAGLFCYDFEGNEIWSRDLGDFEHIWGYGTSPVLHQGRVIMHCGPGKEVFMTALDLATGETLWETEEPVEGTGSRNDDGKYMGSWSTPVIAEVDGKVQVICTMPTRLVGYDPATGKILWWCDGIRGSRGDLAYSSPIVYGDICVAIGGYGGPSIGVKLGGTGDITESGRLWRMEKNPQSIGSGVFIGDFIYRANAARPSPVQCLDPKTAEVVWNGPSGGSSWGSIVAAGGNCYVTTQKGETLVFKPNPEEYEQVAENKLGEPTNSTPAISDGEIFIRTFDHLWCVGE